MNFKSDNQFIYLLSIFSNIFYILFESYLFAIPFISRQDNYFNILKNNLDNLQYQDNFVY